MLRKKESSEHVKIVVSNRAIEAMKQQDAEQKAIVATYDYIRWLEEFTLLHETFTDETWLYKPEEISKADNDNVKRLSLFFEAMSRYCRKYYIDTQFNERFETERIYIKYNDVVYQFGLVVGQGAYVYVVRSGEECGETIAFEDIVNDSKPENFEEKKAQIEKFEQIVAKMRALKIPDSVILEILNR